MRTKTVKCLHSKLAVLSAALGFSLLLGGCEDKRVRVYEVPTERVLAELDPAEGASVSNTGLTWTVPESWESQPAGTMRLANYFSPRGLEIAVSKFPGDVGGDLANINRWRRQLSMPSVTSISQVDGLDPYEVPAGEGKLLRLRPSDASEADSVDVFWISYEGESWFFKINGTAEAITGATDELEAWLQSIARP